MTDTTLGPKPDGFEFVIQMLSDFHTGTGRAGTGGADRGIRTDDQGFPCLGRKHIIGLGRDRAEFLAGALDGPEHTSGSGPWRKWVQWTFGDVTDVEPGQQPKPRQFELSGLRLSPAVRRRLLASVGAEATRFNRPGVKIDSVTGLTVDDHLRLVEHARLGATFACRITGNGLPEAAQALLVLAFGQVDRIGGKRRRGVGHCAVKIDQSLRDWALQWLEENVNPGDPPPSTSVPLSPSNPAEGAVAVKTSAMSVVDVTIELAVPLLTRSVQLGNVAESHDFIPGAVLLATLANEPSLRPLAGTLIAEGAISVGDAVPALDGHATRPRPRTLGRPKRSMHVRPVAEANDGEPVKPFRDGWFSVADGKGVLVDVRKVLRAHNTIEDQLQRPTESVGGLFTYEAIDERQMFVSRVVAPAVFVEKVVDALGTGRSRRLGGSRGDDYGEVVMSACKGSEKWVDWNTGDQITLLADSDILLTDELGRQALDAGALLAAVRGAVKGVTLELDEDATRVGPFRRESWQTRWALPRPSLVGIARGSVLTFDVTDGSLSADQVRDALSVGIGRRIAEGFGRLRPFVSCPDGDDWSESARSPDVRDNRSTGARTECDDALSEDERAYVVNVERRGWLDRLDRMALELAHEPEVWSLSDKLSLSQLGAARAQLVTIRSIGDVDAETELNDDRRRVERWFARLLGVEKRKEMWGEKSIDRARALLTDEREVWKAYGFGPGGLDPPPPELSLRADATRLLLLARVTTELVRTKRRTTNGS